MVILLPAASGSQFRFAPRAVQQRHVEPMVGILIHNRIGTGNLRHQHQDRTGGSGIVRAGEELDIDFEFEVLAYSATLYCDDVAAAIRMVSSHDWLDDVISFEVLSARQAAGVTDLRARIDWRKTVIGESATHA